MGAEVQENMEGWKTDGRISSGNKPRTETKKRKGEESGHVAAVTEAGRETQSL